MIKFHFFHLKNYWFTGMEYSFGAMAWWLRYWFPNPGVLHAQPLGDCKVHSVFHSSEVDKMSTRNLWGLSQCHIQQFFWGCQFFNERCKGKKHCAAAEYGGTANYPQWVSGAKPRKILAILHSSPRLLNSHLCIFRWINSYSFTKLGAWAWDPTPEYQLQNSSGYGNMINYASLKWL